MNRDTPDAHAASDIVESLFANAIQRGSAREREEYLLEACVGDSALRERVAALLAAHDRAEGFLRTLSEADDTVETVEDGRIARPATIGRYRVSGMLGKGSFGVVYLAHDEQLGRMVAVKLPYNRLLSRQTDVAAYLAEARTVARLDHPGIVPVHDVGSTDEFPCYVVSKYVEGTDLATRLREQRFSCEAAARLVATVACALHYAHLKGLVHRDVKPGNILIGENDAPYVVDFGLALWEENIGTGPKYAGTPAYMSPEQARGEGHRVDRRSDIFSLGVVFYELLAGRRPFQGESQLELLTNVANSEPLPLRQHGEQIPAELQRICQKAMAKRASERYSTAQELADDLECYLTEASEDRNTGLPDSAPTTAFDSDDAVSVSTGRGRPLDAASGSYLASTSDNSLPRIVPKGLRSFDAHDADFFLQLLPGPRDRTGLPESLRFWKSRIEAMEPNRAFTVGLLYGPSGCGKSSLVKAGLLPRLSGDVICVYLEATAAGTETKLLHSLRQRCRAIQDRPSLREALAAIRQGHGLPVGRKVLIVIDQFEQWLHGRTEDQYGQLLDALRQCDGVNLQCILMVRDDFWLASSRFMQALEVRLVDGHNMALVDLFDQEHATRVLISLGQAYGRLPRDARQITEGQKAFVKQSVDGLAEEGKVICVRLALFAAMMKSKPWTSATLKQVGGTEGVGIAFLYQTFDSTGALAECRFHRDAARGVLQTLLPEPGSELKGHMRTRAELLQASGYSDRPSDFDDLLRILDEELRLIAPTTDLDGNALEDLKRTPSVASPVGTSVVGPAVGQDYFQLTHDFLVRPLREWLTRAQRETRRGRAELLLRERSLTWSSTPRNQLLPSFWEFLTILFLTDRKRWTETERKTIRQSTRIHVGRLAVATALLLVLVLGAAQVRRTIRERQEETRAQGLLDSLMNADIQRLPEIMVDIEKDRGRVQSGIQAEYASAAAGSPRKLRAALALLPVDDGPLGCVVEHLITCPVGQFGIIREALGSRADELLWSEANNAQGPAVRRFRAAAALATLQPGDERWEDAAPFMARHLTTSVPKIELGAWLHYIQPAAARLRQPLVEILKNRKLSATQREAAAVALALYLRDDPESLVDIILVADEPAEFSPLIATLKLNFAPVLPRLLSEVRRAPSEDLTGAERSEVRRRQSMAAVTLYHLDHYQEIWPLFKFSADPSLRSYVVFHLGKLGSDPTELAKKLAVEPDTAVRRALLQAIGGSDRASVLPVELAKIVDLMESLYANDSDPGIHSSASWALRQWNLELPQLPTGASGRTDRDDEPGWYVNGQGQTLAVIPNPAKLGLGQLNYTFAVACHEVTVAEYQRFQAEHVVYPEIVPTDDCPVHRVTWYLAAEYCNWLSEREGIPRAEWVYEANDHHQFAEGMRIKDNYLELTGYRLPTEAEWEYACRSGTTTDFSFGDPQELLARYAMYVMNAKGLSQPVESLLPNEFGLFDMHGNSWEWAHDVASDTLSPVRDKDARMLRGGSFSAHGTMVLSGYRLLNSKPEFQHIRYGLRVARRMPAS